MIDILGFIGFIVTILIIVPASLLALIRVFYHPVQEISSLWLELVDAIIEIIQRIKDNINNLK
jgi:hypothetical protein